jgi:hypothetical protein
MGRREYPFRANFSSCAIEIWKGHGKGKLTGGRTHATDISAGIVDEKKRQNKD